MSRGKVNVSILGEIIEKRKTVEVQHQGIIVTQIVRKGKLYRTYCAC